ncbi:MAG: hypothetical protein V3T51_05775 [Gammaproteobacteria bacterium]
MNDYQRYNNTDKTRSEADELGSPSLDRARKVLSLITELDMDRRDVPPNLSLTADAPDISMLEEEGCDPYNSGSFRKPKF